MKITIEINAGKFEYGYEIGSSTQNGTMPLSADGLCCFTDILRMCVRDSSRGVDKFKEEVVAMAMLAKDPELVKKFVKKHKEA